MRGEPGATADLADRMAGPLEFGTAGLRGPVRAGPNGMNTAVVVRTTAGVATWLAGHGKTGETVVIGRDARHGSERFAMAAAEVLYAAGFDARLLPGPLPTPVLAFAVKHLGAAAGVQITASHNPPADNGYKLYDDSGSQIVPPSDGEIEAAIADAPGASAVTRMPGVPVLGETILEEYLARVASIPAGSSRELRVAATALHGVGAEVLSRALATVGFTDVHLVADQAEPDPDFPTVSFPNPEEPGATDLLLALAEKIDADLAIALDPDADRCALGLRDRDGSWQMLRGDETGVLLGEHVLSTTGSPDPLVATTIVSSSMLGRIAEAHGARYAETLTGFKWLTRAGEGLVFAYEEALGLCVNPDFVRDKDGIAAAVLACDLAATLKAAGRSLLDVLDDLSVRHGVHLTDQVSMRVTDLSVRGMVLDAIRKAPPTTLAGTPVTTEDLLPTTDAVRIAGGGLRVVIRPSGTEPKLKTYLQVVAPVPAGAVDERDAVLDDGDAAGGQQRVAGGERPAVAERRSAAGVQQRAAGGGRHQALAEARATAAARMSALRTEIEALLADQRQL
jgi:phosphomannomutase